LDNRARDIEAAREKFDSYDDEWDKVYFDKCRGGFLVVSKQRIEQGNVNKQEKEKYNKEYNMCLVLAKNGNRVEYLKMTEGSFDVYLNGVSADLKKTASHNNMLDYAKKATREQGAEIVIFEFEKETEMIHEEIIQLQKKSIRGKYYFSHNKAVIYDI